MCGSISYICNDCIQSVLNHYLYTLMIVTCITGRNIDVTKTHEGVNVQLPFWYV